MPGAIPLRELFEQAVSLPENERAAFVAACGDEATQKRLSRMLSADTDAKSLFERDASAMADVLGEINYASKFPSGSRIGAFELLGVLGEGGSSIVFRATRTLEGVRQDVALKLLRHGLYSPDAQRQFRRERLALSQLNHPGIARLIEGGITDAGLAYIVLDLVDGIPLTDYACKNTLDLRARLALFLQVCRAVEAAHRALIVHRDLKPSNVLVTPDGQVKLLDFGIAKLLQGDDETQTRLPAFTPSYAAPEQKAGGIVTTATDVYALGILLGQLMTGERLDSTRLPSSQVRDEGEPGRLPAAARTTRKLLQGDLDNIVLKAIEEDPARRYASATALADDIERLLDGRPVAAHLPSRWYRARKFVLRNRGAVIGSSVFLVAIIAALGVALWQARVARQEALRANTVRDFVMSVFGSARANLPRDRRPTPEQLVEAAQGRLATAPIDDLTRADVLLTLGEVSLSLSDLGRAKSQLEEAAAIALRSGNHVSAQRARALRAVALQQAGNNKESLREAIEISARLDGQASTDLIITLDVMANAEMALGMTARALDHRREGVAAATSLAGADGIETLRAELELGYSLVQAQRFPEAIAQLEPVMARWRRLGFEEDTRFVDAFGSLASAYDGVGDTARSESRLRDLLALRSRIYPDPSEVIAATLRDLALIVGRDGAREAEATGLFERALAMQHAVLGPDHEEVASTHVARGNVFAAQRRFPEAETAYRQALEVCERAEVKSEACPRARNDLGMTLYRTERLDEAEAEMLRALEERRALFGDDHPHVAFSLSTLSNVAAKRNDTARAVELAAQSIDVIERSGQHSSREAALMRNTFATALWRADRNTEALVQIDRSLEDWQRVAPEAKPRRVSMLVQKAQILHELGRKDDSRRAAEEGIALDVPAELLQPVTRRLLRTLSGRDDIYPEPAASK